MLPIIIIIMIIIIVIIIAYGRPYNNTKLYEFVSRHYNSHNNSNTRLMNNYSYS